METNQTIDVAQLTQDQIEALKQQIITAEKAKKQAIKNNREEYKLLASDTVKDTFKPLVGLSKHILNIKKLVFDNFQAILEMKSEIYGVKEGQQSHSFTDLEASISIKIGYRVTDAYDDTFSVGMVKVTNYLKRLANNDEAAALVETITDLLKKDTKGNLKASRVLELRKLANRVQDEELSDGIHIIEESYRPTKSCQFVEVKFKDANDKWIALPLSISAFDLEGSDATEEQTAPEGE
ncbi:MAG: DUF3164 family protein [Paludibacter sp.]